MTFKPLKLAIGLSVGTALAFGTIGTDPAAAAPKRGGVLNIVVGSKIPSYDGHQETTFGMIHPIRPFYSLLIRVNPDNPQSPTDFVCDLCAGKVPGPTDNGKTYTFKIKKGVTFHDGQKLTAHDIVATYNKILNPRKGVGSSRKAFYAMVDSVKASDDFTVVFKLKYATGAFIPAMATPFNFVYSKKDIDGRAPNWHKQNINGTGAFIFVQHQPGAFVEGRRNPNYHLKGKPYLDGYKAISAPKMAIRLQSIRGDRAAIEFRGFPPKARDDLVNALGDKITVQESDWNCLMGYSGNDRLKKFKDVRVRKALTLAVDRWGGSKYLSKIAIVKTVGGIVFPKHPLAANTAELETILGYDRDINKSRAEAKRLLKEAGKEGMEIELWNRAVDQPYKVVGTWLIDQWRKAGFKAKQQVVPSGPWYDRFRKKKTHEVLIDFNCQGVVNPLADLSKWNSATIAGNNYAGYEDPVGDKLLDQANRTADPKVARSFIRKFERRILHEEAHYATSMWWYKINPHRSYVKGWNIAPSHYLNQHLDQVWLDK
jgi:peptide/nickel transport system substrate-binding protein